MGQIIDYLKDNNLDPDVFFTSGEGPISRQMREKWVADHELATEHSNIEYDNKTGFYNFTFRVPDDLAQNYRENKDSTRKMYHNYSQTDVLFTSSGVYISGTVQTPGTAVLLSKMVEKPATLNV